MANLSLKNIPDDLYKSLKAAAEANHRSINGELIALLENSLTPRRRSVRTILDSARILRQSITGGPFDSAEIDDFKRSGRP